MIRSIPGGAIIEPVHGHVVDLVSICTLNEVGSVEWGHLGGVTTISQIIDAMNHKNKAMRADRKPDIVTLIGAIWTSLLS